MQVSFINELIQRLSTKSPAFFKKLQFIAGIISVLVWLFNGAISKHLIILPNSAEWINILNTVGGVCIGICAGTLTTTTDPKLISPEVKTAIVEHALNQSQDNIKQEGTAA